MDKHRDSAIINGYWSTASFGLLACVQQSIQQQVLLTYEREEERQQHRKQD